MGKGIRELAMSPEPEKEKSEFESYPSSYGPRYYGPGYDTDRYDGEYDGSKYKKEEEERKDIIKITMTVTYQQLGPEFDMNSELYQYEAGRLEERARELVYD